VRWTPGEEELSFGWFAFGGPPLIVELPAEVEVRFSYGGAGCWALEGPDGPLARSDGRRAVAWSDGTLAVGGSLMVAPGPQQLLLPEPPQEGRGARHVQAHDAAADDVQADEVLGRQCWRWSLGDQVRWVDEETGCLLRMSTRAGLLELTDFQPGAPVDGALFDLDEWVGPYVDDVRSGSRAERETPVEATFVVPWWPHGALSSPVGGDPDVPSLLVLLNTGDRRAPSVWLGVAPLGERAPVRPGVRSRRWDGEDCSLSLSWGRRLSEDEAERIIASIPERWP
jgi:hypothetical protein